MNFIINALEKELQTKSKSLDVVYVNGELEGILDCFVTMQAKVLNGK